MLIKKGGVYRTTSNEKFNTDFKKLGYKIIEAKGTEEEPEVEQDLFELTNEELKEMCKEKDLPVYGAKKELVERLRVV